MYLFISEISHFNVVNRRNEKKGKQNKILKRKNLNSVQIDREKKIKYAIVLIKDSYAAELTKQCKLHCVISYKIL